MVLIFEILSIWFLLSFLASLGIGKLIQLGRRPGTIYSAFD